MPTAQRFAADRPNVHALPPWHRLAYVMRALPAQIAELSGELPRTGRILDYGCADMPYRGLFDGTADYVGADLPGNPRAAVEIAPDGTVPIDDASCDAVLSTQVLEHVADPATYLSECFRVLRPGGRMLLSTHGLMVWHPDPVDYWRWTCEGLRRAVTDAGLDVHRFEGIMGLAASGLQLFQDGMLVKVPRPLHPPVSLFMQTLIAGIDRLTSSESKRLNALVFAVVAEKPR